MKRHPIGCVNVQVTVQTKVKVKSKYWNTKKTKSRREKSVTSLISQNLQQEIIY
jgi:hypothetical protein